VTISNQNLADSFPAPDEANFSFEGYCAAFQPVFKANDDGTSYTAVSAEALVRRIEPDGSTSKGAPTEVFQEVDKRGLHTEFFLHMLEQAYKLQTDLRDQVITDITTNVNIDAEALFNPDLIDDIKELQRQYPDIPAKNIGIEVVEDPITRGKEAGPSQDAAQAYENLRRINHDVGYLTGIDDYGQNAATNSRFDTFSRHNILSIFKYDMLFMPSSIDEEEEEEIDKAIDYKVSIFDDYLPNVKGAIEKRGTKVICEGAETLGDLDFIEKVFNGKAFIQGFVLSEPLSHDDTLELLEKGGTVTPQPKESSVPQPTTTEHEHASL